MPTLGRNQTRVTQAGCHAAGLAPGALSLARSLRHRSATIAVLICCLGCHASKRSFEPTTNPDELGDVQFLHYLAGVPTVSVDEGIRGVLMAAGPTEQEMTRESRLAELERQGAIKAAWVRDGDESLTMGTLAYMLGAVCGAPRGVNIRISRLIGVGERRYALRGCVDAGLLPYATPDQPVRGGELVTAIVKCSERLEGARSSYDPAPSGSD